MCIRDRYISSNEITNQFSNQPIDTFEGYYQSEKGRVISIFTGLKFNPERLSQIQQSANDSVSAFQKSHQSTTIHFERPKLNLNKPKEKKSLTDILAKHKS